VKLLMAGGEAPPDGRVGPICIACGNTRSFRVRTPDGESLVQIRDLHEDTGAVCACGRCGSRHSIVASRVE